MEWIRTRLSFAILHVTLCAFEGIAQSGAHLDWLMEHLLLCNQNVLSGCCIVFMWFCFFIHLFLLFLFVFSFVTGSVSGPWDKMLIISFLLRE